MVSKHQSMQTSPKVSLIKITTSVFVAALDAVCCQDEESRGPSGCHTEKPTALMGPTLHPRVLSHR